MAAAQRDLERYFASLRIVLAQHSPSVDAAALEAESGVDDESRLRAIVAECESPHSARAGQCTARTGVPLDA